MKNRTLAFYIRLSDADESVKKGVRDESNSISGQRELLLSYVNNNAEFSGFSVKEYFDDGFSGTGFAKREQFQKMLSDAKEGQFECLLVKDFSRLGRDYLEVGNFMEFIFPAMGIRFISVNDNYDSNKNRGMTGGMDVVFKNLIYQMYSRDLSRKVKSSRKNRNQNGEYTASFAKYGYIRDPNDHHKLLIDDKTAGYVKEIFEKVAGGTKISEIVHDFNQRHIPTKLEAQKEKSGFVYHGDKSFYLWNYGIVYRIVKDEGYTGRLIQNKLEMCGFGDTKKLVMRDKSEWSIVEGGMPAIITKELFEKANAALINFNPKEKEKKVVNLFTCPYCNRKLYRSGSRNNGYYICPVRRADKSKLCASIHIHKEEAEELILENVREACLKNIAKKEELAEKLENSQGKEQLEVEKSRLESIIISSYKQYQSGDISREEYISSRKEVKDRIAEIEKDLEQLSGEEAEQDCGIETWEEVLEQMTSEYDGALFSKVIDKVLVYEDNSMEVIFKGKN